MIKVSSKKNKYTYNVYHLVKAFFPNEEIIQNVDEKQESLVALNLPEGLAFPLRLRKWKRQQVIFREMETERGERTGNKKKN
mgnify:FL=1